MRDKQLIVELGPGDRVVSAKHVYQWDYGVELVVRGDDIRAMDVHFSCANSKSTIAVAGVVNGSDALSLVCKIPDVLLMQDSMIKAYMYREDADSGITVREIAIPVVRRPRPQDTYYTPEEHAKFDELFSQLQALLENTQDAQDLIVEGAQVAENLLNIQMEVNQQDGCLYLDM